MLLGWLVYLNRGEDEVSAVLEHVNLRLYGLVITEFRLLTSGLNHLKKADHIDSHNNRQRTTNL